MATHLKMCCYKKCNTPSQSLDARVEVKTLLSGKNRPNTKTSLVNWKSNGEADFHQDCWKTLLSAKLSKGSSEPGLTKGERELIKTAAESSEHFDDLETILTGARRTADWLKTANHCVAFTGAGISTSAGIGDYRGKAGKWTEEDQMQKVGAGGSSCEEPPVKKQKTEAEEEDQEDEDGVQYEKLRPTYTHEALYKLMESGYLKYIISQNGDGLHSLSGVTDDKISELHGNVFVEICEKCNHTYHRPYYTLDDVGSQYFEEMEDDGKSSVKKPRHAVKCDTCGLTHRTGRKCEKKECGGFLHDTIINFRDLLDVEVLLRAKTNSRRSDMMLCLGTTLQVTPASSLVKRIKGNYKLAICNRQETHLDDQALRKGPDGKTRGVRAFGDCDIFMKEVMKCVYSAEELFSWETARGRRLTAYGKHRD